MASRQDRGKAPLYRKVNTGARGVRHRRGGDYKWSRGKAAGQDRASLGAMGKEERRGLDDTPLLRFLLSRAGED